MALVSRSVTELQGRIAAEDFRYGCWRLRSDSVDNEEA